ncbi:MAG: hypothetical protein ACREFW_06030 [Rhizomicrobium sp.]
MRQALARSAATLLAVILVLVLFFGLRWTVMAGVFAGMDPVSPGPCRAIAGLEGPGDFAVDAPHDTIIVAATDRRALAARPDPRDGLYALKLSAPGSAAPIRLSGTPKDAHLQGISLLHGPGGQEVLMAVNHPRPGIQEVEIFSLTYERGAPKLTPRSNVAGGLLVSAHDVAAAAPDRFYVTNDHVTKSAAGRFAENYLLWPHSDLLYFNGTSFRISLQGLTFPSGVFVTADGGHLYVSVANQRRIIGFSREPFFGTLTEIGSLDLPARPDMISADRDGRLIVAARPSLLGDRQFQDDASKPSPSEVFRVTLDRSGAPDRYETIFANDGSAIGAASSAAVAGKLLLIGSALDDKMLACRIN